KLAIGLVREVTAKPTEAAPLKLSEEKRKKLLAQFKKPRPQESFWLKRLELPSLVTALVVLGIVALLAAIVLPNFVKARATSQANAIVNNLRQIDAAKNQWAMEKGKPADAVPTTDDLKPYIKNGFPQSLAGEKYIVGAVSEPVAADVDAAHARKLGGLAARLPTFGQDDGHVRLFADGVEDVRSSQQMLNNPKPAQRISPGVVTVSPSPILAPPPAEIVLPQTESTPEAPALPGTLAYSENGSGPSAPGVYYNAGVMPSHALDSFGDVKDEGRGNRQSQGAYSFGLAGGGSGSGGSGGGAPQLQGEVASAVETPGQARDSRAAGNDQNSTMLAWHESSGARSRTEQPTGAATGGFALADAAGTSGDAWQKPEIGYGLPHDGLVDRKLS
ncbi:MAG TPA: hypothetical protein VNM37_02645, partial [Candidatus Dormibacteraeota bacterium]|nr:hypothetical protein [Candidatus Dormibacteraeota bacterium]